MHTNMTDGDFQFDPDSDADGSGILRLFSQQSRATKTNLAWLDTRIFQILGFCLVYSEDQ